MPQPTAPHCLTSGRPGVPARPASDALTGVRMATSASPSHCCWYHFCCSLRWRLMWDSGTRGLWNSSAQQTQPRLREWSGNPTTSPRRQPRLERHPDATALQHGVSGVNVDVQRVLGESRQLDVTITDPQVPTFFGSVVLKQITMTRKARARYVLPIPLGSPLNTFGNQNLTPSAD